MKKLTLDLFQDLKDKQESFFIYFSAPNCGVCQILRPKIEEMFIKQFPKLIAYHVDTANQPELAAQSGLYTNPSLLVFMNGQEVLRRSRAIGVDEVESSLERYYNMLFDE
ncbi:thioredoxin family protein [Marinifilum sp. RC60d5]|uniref:thioredoxin family protein n=1 Tax=Marinifilum sp. RC60d5 TaxID=3458414 RepID=UPI0040352A37